MSSKQPLQIFLIDDDADDREIFADILKEILPDVTCIFAIDGMNAMEKIQSDISFVPDFIFIDINMPRMNGIQLLSEIKKIAAIKTIPVFMYSTSVSPVIIKECTELGSAGFIEKSCNIDELKADLQKVILSGHGLMQKLHERST